jgi:DegV family protein with EDD domain
LPNRDPAAWPWIRSRLAAVRAKQDAARRDSAAARPDVVVRTAVVTDSAAALPADWTAGLSGDGRLTVIPMPVMVGDEIYGEGEDDISETIALALASGTSVKTSRPSPGQFEQAYLAAQRRGYEAVVSVHISGGLSGTADAARLAAARVGIHVEVVDSATVGMALGMAVQESVRTAAEGAGAGAVAAAAAGQAASTKVYFYVPSLEQLRRAGGSGRQLRCGAPCWPSNPSWRSTTAGSYPWKRSGPLPRL